MALALISTLLSSNALAADKGGKNKKNKKDEDKSVATMDVGNDPVRTEKSDGGPYAPKGATGALAEKNKEEEEVAETFKARPRDKKLLFADVVAGFGRAPKPGPDQEEVGGSVKTNRLRDSIVGSFILGANFDVSPKVSLGLRLPVGLLALERSAQNGKDSYVALGLPEILAEYRPEMSSPRWSLPILFGLGIPVATDEPDITTGEAKAVNNRTNIVADAARGWRDGELFWSKRVPVILGVGIRHEGRSFEWHAATKFVTGVKISGDIVKADFYGDPTGHVKNNRVAIRNVTDVGFSYSFSEKFWAGLDLWTAFNILEPQTYDSPATPPPFYQFVAEPKLGLRLGKVRPSLGFIAPLGGRLADSGIYGAHLRLDIVL